MYSTQVKIDAPPVLQPGQTERLRFDILDSESREPVSDILQVHNRPAHLILVRRDLERFQHLHPHPVAAAGAFEVDATFQEPGIYVGFLEAERRAGEQILERFEISVGDESTARGTLSPDTKPVLVGDHLVSLSLPRNIRAGETTSLRLRVARIDTGAGVTDLRPYLGAAAHVVILDAAAQDFGHAHAADARREPGEHGDHHAHPAPTRASLGPDLDFSHIFPKPGLYRLWAQYLPGDGDVRTASFTVSVE